MNPTQTAFPLAAPDWAALPRAETESLYEVVNGQHVELLPMGALECWIAGRLLVVLEPFCDAHDLGMAFVETLFLLTGNGDLQRRPDVAFVSYDRWPKDRPIPSAAPWAVVPDLAVEVVSPSNTFVEISAKIREYFQAGCRSVWVIVPTERQVQVYRAPTEIHCFGRDQVLRDEAVLPGFELPLEHLFRRTQRD